MEKGEEVYQWIYNRIVKRIPTTIGRIGGNEAMMALWANSIPIKPYPFLPIPTGYWQTSLGAANAGIRPRNRISYKLFGRLIFNSIQHLDMMGVWKEIFEWALLQRLETPPLLVNVEAIAPSVDHKIKWMAALDGKTVLVVSPFIDSFEKQLKRLPEIWPNWEKVPNFTMKGIKFPYLIEEDCPLTWWEVYTDIAKVVRASEYDVALFGCGGLGLPLAAMTRCSGKIGIHLGGHLQLFFGVYGQRFLHHEWHRRCINDAWVRPAPHEVPRSASRVEGGCYW